MKLIRFGEVKNEKPGLQLTNGKRIDVSAFGFDYDENFFGSQGLKRLKDWLLANQNKCPEIGENIRLMDELASLRLINQSLNLAASELE